MKIYLDNASTTQVDKKVIKAMLPYFTEKYGNASSLHSLGQEAKMALEESRATIAKSINAKEDEIIFTSSATESNNLALKGIAFANKQKGKHIITTEIEHDCVLNSCEWLKKQGFKITYLNVDREGFINLRELENSIKKDTILVSIIHANNEIGTIQDLAEIGKICQKYNIYFHTDAAQSYTKVPINVKKQNLDLVTLNAHKIHGPKGVGALFVKKDTNIMPLLHGGGHEFNLRSGTENIAGIVGFAKAVKLCSARYVRHMEKLRDRLINGVLKIPDTMLNGPKEKNINKGLCSIANLSFKYIEGEAIGAYLDAKGVSSSTGSACATRSLEPSHVLLALGLTHEEAHGSLRLSLSRFTTKEEIDYVIKILPGIIEKLRRMSPFVK